MADMGWNDKQKQAIDARGGSVVVSAAAGSGKTSVLAERVLRLIEDGADIEQMLIVTFTNLAAAEMRERIYKRLLDAARKQNSPRLAAQAEKCVFADISTIHAFCNKLVRDNFEHAGVSPAFTVGGNSETGLMRERAMHAVIEENADGIRPFLQKYAPRGNMFGVQNVVSAIYRRAVSMASPDGWLDDAQRHFADEGFIDTLFDAYRQMAQAAAQTADGILKQRSELWRDRGFAAQADASENERVSLAQFAKDISMQNAALPEIGSIAAPGVKGAPNRESATFSRRAGRALQPLREYEAGFAAKVGTELQSVAEDASVFLTLTRAFMAIYAQRKRDRNVLDHDDALHCALKALQKDAIAARCRERFAHVFVDEYQDINNVQDEIIRRMLRGGNDFLVGDVKQCIYMFRESNPELLMRRCDALRESGLIEMNTNYRSAPGVVGFINGMMAHMMDENAGGVRYAGGQQLAAGAGGSGEVRVVMAGGEDKTTAEARQIAAEIHALHAQGVAYKDIAVLRPEVGSTGAAVARVLAQAGIPAACGFARADSRFSETAVFVHLLAVIDGSGDDISLLAAMRYPYFGFTEPEMARIRIWASGQQGGKDMSFAQAARRCDIADALGDKLRRFWRQIDHYRTLADSLAMPDFLTRLRQAAMFEEYALTGPGGSENDRALRTLIREASSMPLKSVGEVLALSERLLAESGAAPSPGETDAVYVTTIHQSKGLEFEAVILSGLHRKIVQTDSGGAVLVGRSLGIALDAVDGDTRIKTPTLHKQMVAERLRREKISETVRLLYVGMTRAKKRLILCGAGSEIPPRWTEEKAEGWQFGATTHFDLVMPALHMACKDHGQTLEDTVVMAAAEDTAQRLPDKEARLDALLKRARQQPCREVYAGYPYASSLGIPSKVSVSALKRLAEPEPMRPAFLPAESDEITAAQRGTLMHKVLQTIGLDEKNAAQVSARVDEMAAAGVIDMGHAEHVDAKAISRFLASDVAARARSAQKSMLEAPCCLALNADEAGLTESDEPVVVQGVIDLCFIEDNEWVIVDYKTDRVGKSGAADAAGKYRVQLDLYAKALARITGIAVKERLVFFLRTGEAVNV